MRVHLSPHAHLAILGDDAVLLDLRTGEYLCAPGGRAALRPSRDRRTLAPTEPNLLAELCAAGLTTDEASLRPAPPPLPRRHVLDAPARRLTRGELLCLGLCLWDLARRYWRRPLGDILAFADREGGGLPAAVDAARAADLAAAFQAALVWLPLPRKCLVRSFVLLRLLQRSGVRAQWVLGVRTWPFSAHCWVQAGDVALDDAAERLAVYEPIVAVG